MDNTIPAWLRIVGVLIFVGAGLWLIGMSLEWLPTLGGELVAPRWIAGLAGFIFCLCAVYLVLDSAPDRFAIARQLVMLAFVISFAVAFSWLAFGDGPRDFHGDPDVSGPATDGISAERDGRLAFGALAVLSYVLIAAACWRLAKAIKKAGHTRTVRSES